MSNGSMSFGSWSFSLTILNWRLITSTVIVPRCAVVSVVPSERSAVALSIGAPGTTW